MEAHLQLIFFQFDMDYHVFVHKTMNVVYLIVMDEFLIG
jgi:hypothetical protein